MSRHKTYTDQLLPNNGFQTNCRSLYCLKISGRKDATAVMLLRRL